MTSPLRLSFEVACPVEHAFTVWTSGIGAWWPRDHTVTGDEGLRVVLQSGVGGRIFERTPDGIEHNSGEITVWEPPVRLAYRWHLGQDRADATEVDIQFRPAGSTTTSSRSNTTAGSASARAVVPSATATRPAGNPCSRTTSLH